MSRAVVVIYFDATIDSVILNGPRLELEVDYPEPPRRDVVHAVFRHQAHALRTELVLAEALRANTPPDDSTRVHLLREAAVTITEAGDADEPSVILALPGAGAHEFDAATAESIGVAMIRHARRPAE